MVLVFLRCVIVHVLGRSLADQQLTIIKIIQLKEIMSQGIVRMSYVLHEAARDGG